MEQPPEVLQHLVRPKILNYEARGVWDRKTGGRIRFPGLPDVRFDTPVSFGGLGAHACADQLFLSSLAACLMATFLYYGRRMRFRPVHVEANVRARISLAGRDAYRFSGIKIALEVVSMKDDRVIARRCADLAMAYCHLTKTVAEVVPMSVKARVRVR